MKKAFTPYKVMSVVLMVAKTTMTMPMTLLTIEIQVNGAIFDYFRICWY